MVSMKKHTKQYLIVLFIILIFGMSTIAFVTTGFLGGTGGNQFKPLASPIVEGELDPIYENTYIQKGFTWLKFYYTDADPRFLAFIDSLPEAYATNTGQTQMIVQKINKDYAGKQQYVVVSSQQGVDEIENPDKMKIVNSLCALLTFIPAECGFVFNITASNV
jgi:hypothetical protein